MRKRTKILSILLAVTMLASAVVGCGTSEAPAESEQEAVEAVQEEVVEETGSTRLTEETVTYTLAGKIAGAATTDWSDIEQLNEYEKRLGVKFEGTAYDPEAWESKFTLMLASDELADVIVNAGLDRATLEKYAADGYFLDFSQYLDLMPNLSAVFEKYPEYKDAVTMSDGGIYGFGKLNAAVTEAALAEDTFISQTWLDNLGLEMPKTVDELYNVLVAFKTQDPNGNGEADEIPMTYAPNAGRTQIESLLMKAYGIPVVGAYGIPSIGVDYNVSPDENGKIQYWDLTDEFKEVLKFLNKCYEEELINQDCYTVESGVVWEKIFAEQFGVLGTFGPYTAESIQNMGWTFIPGFTHPDYESDNTVYTYSRVEANYNFMVNSEVENPELIAKFVDYLFTTEGALSAANGYEGVTFDYKDVCGYDVVDHTNYSEGYESAEAYRINKAVVSSGFSLISVQEGTIWDVIAKAEDDVLMSDEFLELGTVNASKAVDFRHADFEVKANPMLGLVYTEEENKELATLRADIKTYLASAKAQFIAGERDIDATWEEHIKTVEGMGLQRLLEIEQAAYDRKYGN